MRILVSACLAACSLYGQAGKIAAPSMGFVFDQSAHALRRIQGIPGAALVGLRWSSALRCRPPTSRRAWIPYSSWLTATAGRIFSA